MTQNSPLALSATNALWTGEGLQKPLATEDFSICVFSIFIIPRMLHQKYKYSENFLDFGVLEQINDARSLMD